MFAQQHTSIHAPSIALLDEGRTPPARPTDTTPCSINEITVAVPGTLAGHPQFKVPGQHATVLSAICELLLVNIVYLLVKLSNTQYILS